MKRRTIIGFYGETIVYTYKYKQYILDVWDYKFSLKDLDELKERQKMKKIIRINRGLEVAIERNQVERIEKLKKELLEFAL